MQKFRTFSRILLAIFFIIAGIGHFLIPEFYLRMIPPYLPYPQLLNYLSGLLEIILGIMAFIPRHFNKAKWGMIALLVAIFPANIHMAMNPEVFPEINSIGLWVRLPFQIVFMFWVLYALNPRSNVKN